MTSHQAEEVFVLQQLLQHANSVGIIKSPNVCATGFRVGSCYVMTAKHVVDNVRMTAQFPSLQQNQLDLHQVDNEMFIDFAFKRDGHTVDWNQRFYFEREIMYASDHLDTVILKLKPSSKEYPPPLTRFAVFQREYDGYLISHSRANVIKIDEYKVCMPTPDTVRAAKEWSWQHVNMDGFVGIDDPYRVLLRCSSKHVAAGSPGFSISIIDGQAYVQLMLLCGYPTWYYDENYRHKAVGISEHYLIEQGVSLKSIYNDMKIRAAGLCVEIFEAYRYDLEPLVPYSGIKSEPESAYPAPDLPSPSLVKEDRKKKDDSDTVIYDRRCTRYNTPRDQEQSLELQVDGRSKVSKAYDIFSSRKKQEVFIQNNPRYCQIITMSVEDMRRYIGKKIGEGAFGIVYKAKLPEEEKCKFAIKEIQVTEELFQKAYDKEIHNGRILHPFISPVIARAESHPAMSDKRISYIMYPYMKNKDVHHNINRVNGGNNLSPKESNSQIWSRCIYQIVQAVDFLHRSVASVREPIFHRDLTSHNIFLDVNFNVRIGDFGIAVEAKGNKTHATQTRVMGTEGYHPPNMNSYQYHASYDIFSVGVVMLEILTGLEARLNEDPYYLYKKYACKKGYDFLVDDLDERADQIEAAGWVNKENKFAKLALEAVDLDESKRKKINLLQKLEGMRLNSKEQYRKPENLDRCVSCCINPIAKLSTKGQDCTRNRGVNPCQYFCLHCLMNHHFNPLVCPQHGKTRPPFGDHVYGVFVAGNDVNEEQHHPSMQGPNCGRQVAETFIGDVQKVAKILIAKHPFVLGASERNIRVVVPEEPGTKVEMETNLKQAFKELNAAIKQAIQENNLDPEKDRLPNSLFLFYFSGHCSTDKGLQLGSKEETLKASTTWIQKMLHIKLGVDQIGVVLDCCHADSQNFTAIQGLNDTRNSKYYNKEVTIVQISSCDQYEKSRAKLDGCGSSFTSLFCRGLLGLDSIRVQLEDNMMEDDTVIFCKECEEHRTDQNIIDMTLPCGMYHNHCLIDHGISFYTMKRFIHGHFQLLRTEFMTPVYNAQREKEVFLAYYNPYKWDIPIHLKGSDASYSYWLRSQPASMDTLRQDIIKHIAEKGSPGLLDLYCCYGKHSSHLIAIHPKYGKDKDGEFTSLDSIYKARSCSRDLEARVRENIKGILNGPVKLNKINATMVTSSMTSLYEDHFKINRSCIQIPIKTIGLAENKMKEIRHARSYYPEDIKTLIKEVLKTLRTLQEGVLEGRQENVLNFNLYNAFTVLTIE